MNNKIWIPAGLVLVMFAGLSCTGRGGPFPFRFIDKLERENIISSPLADLEENFAREEIDWQGSDMILLEGGAQKTWAVPAHSRLLASGGASPPDGMVVTRDGRSLEHGLTAEGGGWGWRRVEEKFEPERQPGHRRFRGAVLLPPRQRYTTREFFCAAGRLQIDILASSRDGTAYLPILQVYLDEKKVGSIPVCSYRTYRLSFPVTTGYHRLSVDFSRHILRAPFEGEALLLLDRIQAFGSNDLFLIASSDTPQAFRSGRFHAVYPSLPAPSHLPLQEELKPGESVEIPVLLQPGLNTIEISAFLKHPGTFLKFEMDGRTLGMRRMQAWQHSPHSIGVFGQGNPGRMRVEWVVPDPSGAAGTLSLSEVNLHGPAESVWLPLYRIRTADPIFDRGIDRNPLGIKKKLIYGEHTLNALFAPPGSHFRFPMRIPEHAVLRCGWGAIDPTNGALDRQVRFKIELEIEGESRLILDRAVTVGPPPAVDRLPQESVDLARFAGRKAVVSLITESVPSESLKTAPQPPSDIPPAFWFNPQIDISVEPAEQVRPNIILISVDTLRADHLGCYGYDRDTSPAMDAFSRDGILFSRFYSHSPSTLPAHMSMLTGLHPTGHELLTLPVGGAVRGQVLDPAVSTLPDMLRSEGYATAAFTGGAQVSGVFGFNRGFDSYQENRAAVALDTAPALYTKAAHWVERNRDHPFFLFLHTYQVHAPYLPPSDQADRFLAEDAAWRQADITELLTEREGKYSRMSDSERENLIALYDGEIRYMDEGFIEPFLALLKRLDLYDNSLIILTADHGEEFGEHRGWEHGHSLYDELIHVPLIIRRPGGAGAGSRVDDVCRMIDLMPTILEEAGIEPDGLSIDGLSLLPILTGRRESPRTSVGYRFHAAVSGDSRLILRYLMLNISMIDGNRKLIVNEPYPDPGGGEKTRFWRIAPPPFEFSPREFYDLAADPGETRNLAGAFTGPVSELMEKLRPHIGAARESTRLERTARPSLDKQMEERLRALGYIK